MTRDFAAGVPATRVSDRGVPQVQRRDDLGPRRLDAGCDLADTGEGSTLASLVIS